MKNSKRYLVNSLCGVTSCVRQLPKHAKRTSANYEIEETCEYAKKGVCPFPEIKRKVLNARENSVS